MMDNREANSRPAQLYRAYNREIQKSITIGSAFAYGGLAGAVYLVFSGSNWAAPILSAAAGMCIGYYFAQVRLVVIDGTFRAKGLGAQNSAVDLREEH